MSVRTAARLAALALALSGAPVLAATPPAQPKSGPGGADNNFDVAAVISADSDLIEPIRIATQELGKVVGLLSPVSKPNPQLVAAASFVRHLGTNHLAAAQFADPLTLADGSQINKPAAWT